jgi:hypothetical protein
MTDWPTEAGKERAAREWLCRELRALAAVYQPGSPGEPGHEVEGRVIASDIYALVSVVEEGLAAGSRSAGGKT